MKKNIHKDVEDSNKLEDKASNIEILQDDPTNDKSNQNANEVQDTLIPEKNINQIISSKKIMIFKNLHRVVK